MFLYGATHMLVHLYVCNDGKMRTHLQTTGSYALLLCKTTDQTLVLLLQMLKEGKEVGWKWHYKGLCARKMQVPLYNRSGVVQVRRVGLPVEGEWVRWDMRLPELWRLASMLRLFLTASKERRLVRGARLGMLCLNSSGTTHTEDNDTMSIIPALAQQEFQWHRSLWSS